MTMTKEKISCILKGKWEGEMRIVVFGVALACIIYAAGASEIVDSANTGSPQETTVNLDNGTVNTIISKLGSIIGDSGVATPAPGDTLSKTKTALLGMQIGSDKLKRILAILNKSKKDKKDQEIALKHILTILNDKELLQMLIPLLDK